MVNAGMATMRDAGEWRSSGVVVGHGSNDVGVAQVGTAVADWVFEDLGQDQRAGLAVLTDVSDDRDAAFRDGVVSGLLRNLDVGCALFLDVLDEVATFADYHTGSAVRHQNFHLKTRGKITSQIQKNHVKHPIVIFQPVEVLLRRKSSLGKFETV